MARRSNRRIQLFTQCQSICRNVTYGQVGRPSNDHTQPAPRTFISSPDHGAWAVAFEASVNVLKAALFDTTARLSLAVQSGKPNHVMQYALIA
jgi:hypothetical protein